MFKTRLFYVAVFLAGIVSCTKQEVSEKVPVRIMSDVSDCKTSLSGKSVFWTKGDETSVFDGVSNNRFTTTGEGEKAVFTGSAAAKDKYYVLYPYSSSSTLSGEAVSATFPQHQTAVDGSFARGANVSAGIATKSGDYYSAVMKNVGCFFKFSVGSSSSGLKMVSVAPVGTEKIAGGVTITFDANGVPSAAESGSAVAGASIAPASGNFKAGTYYLVLRPSTLAKGLRVTVSMGSTVTDYDFPTITKMERNSIYNISNIDSGDFRISNEDVSGEVYIFSATNEAVRTETLLTPWNNWTDAASVKANLLRARDEKKVYYSQFKFYNYETTGNINSYKSLGLPMIYALDFYKSSGEFFPESEKAGILSNTISIVTKAWRNHRAIPSMSWHLESPYAVYNDFFYKSGCKGMGCRYVDQSHLDSGDSKWVDNFQETYRYQVKDILNNREVHYVNKYTNGATGEEETFERTFKLGDWFDDRCREVAGIINQFVDDDGRPIPILFRLWHEQEDRWAWWQLYYYKPYFQNCSVDDYKKFWQRTVTNFRKMCPKAQILFVFGPNRQFEDESTYLLSYPGDDYVDIMGYDDYTIGRDEKFSGGYDAAVNAMLLRSRIVSKAAKKHGKIAMICETNNDSSREELHSKFYTDYVNKILSDSQSSLSLFQIWSAPANTDAKLSALSAFLGQDNVIFEK